MDGSETETSFVRPAAVAPGRVGCHPLISVGYRRRGVQRCQTALAVEKQLRHEGFRSGLETDGEGGG